MPKPLLKSLHLKINSEESLTVFQALANKTRLRIIQLLTKHALINVSDITRELDLPLSTTILHLKKLEEAKLIHTELQPSSGGVQKLCNIIYNDIFVSITSQEIDNKKDSIEVEMPIGAFTQCSISPTCGLASEKSIIGWIDDPSSFYEPSRIDAQILWFKKGSITYLFPNRVPRNAKLFSLAISMELCSEAPMHHPNWPSDITLWINGIEIGTWTSPSDFGGERGILTPEWWSIRHTQYGILKQWKINQDGCFIDGIQTSPTTLEQLHLHKQHSISVTLGIKDDAKYVGGLNLFGKKFGNYKQDIIMSFEYDEK